VVVLGIFGSLPRPFMFIAEWVATLICLLSLGALGLSLIIDFLEPVEKRVYFYYVAFNLLPTLHFLSRLRETPWWWPVS
jgi:hypothetical protein